MNKELQSKLKKYSAAAVAVAATGISADAQVVYNMVNKTLNLANPIDSVDINADGTFDLGMVINDYPSYSATVITGGPINSQGHAMAGSTTSSYNYPFKLNTGDQINTQLFIPDDSFGSFSIVVAGSNPFYSHWNGGVADGYLGMKLKIGANTHYGWVRMDITANNKTIVIKDMAYNSTPGGAMQAGQGHPQFGIESYEAIANSVWITGNTLHTELLTGFTTAAVSLIDISGKTIHTFALDGAVNTFDLGELPAGTYVLSLQMDGNTFNKKAVVQ
jgi:hypothetical protein